MTDLPDQGKTPVRAGVIVFAALAAGAVLYLACRELLSMYGLYFQSRILIPGEALTFLILPMGLLILPVTASLRAAHRDVRGGRALAAVVCTVAVIAGFLYLTVGSLVYALLRAPEIEQERWLGERRWIEGIGEESVGLESFRVYHFYEPVAGVLKRRYEPLSDIIEWKAQERYGETFVVSGEDKAREAVEALDYYTLRQVSDPEIVMHMLAGDSWYGFADDYPQALANRRLFLDEEFCAIAESAPEQKETGGSLTDCFVSGPVVVIDSEADGLKKAGVIARAIDGAMEDLFFHRETHKALLTLRIRYEDGTTLDIEIPFGNQAANHVNDRTNGMVHEDYYADEVHVREAISFWYENEPRESRESDGGDDPGWDAPNGTQPEGEGDPGQNGPNGTQDGSEESTPETVEGAYRCLYEAVFEPQGCDYECRYNAKGNFYAVVSHGRKAPGEDLAEMDTECTVVYDRVSKNGECHLFMYYETYYDENGSEYTTAIRNSYAVNMTTGEVTESGKRSWAQAGSAAYQEAAGEP